MAGKKGEVLVDLRQCLPGRGAYICYRADCLKQGLERNRLAYRLKSKMVVLDKASFMSQFRDQLEEKLFGLIKEEPKAGKLMAGRLPQGQGWGFIARDVSLTRKGKLISYCRKRGWAWQEMGTKESLLRLTRGKASAFLLLAESKIGEELKRGLSLFKEMLGGGDNGNY